jgi:membrane protease YdiL (CAAX protease family)
MQPGVSPGEPPIEPEPPRGLARPGALAWVTVVGCLGLFITAGIAVQIYDVGFGIWFTEIFLLLGLAWSLVRASGRSPWSYCRLEGPSPTQMLFGFALGTTNYFAFVIPLQFIATSIAPKSLLIDAGKIFEQQSQFELTLVTVGVGVIAPLCEELVFRGVFQQGLLARLRPAAAIVTAAAIFSAFHFDVVGFIARFELGCLFGILFYRYGSLWPGVFAHAANNLVPTAMFFAMSGAANEQEPTAPEVFKLALFGIAVFALVLSATQWLPELRRSAKPPPPPADPENAPGFLQAYRPWAIAALISAGLWIGGSKLIRHYRHPAKPAAAKQYRL